jgi:hypothetical protein
VTNTAGRYQLTLEIQSKGERVLEAPTCEAIASSAAVVLAMSFDPPAPTAQPVSEAPASAAREPNANAPERATRPREASSFRRAFHARLHAIGDVGMLPAFGAGGGLAIGFEPVSSVYVEMTGNLWGSQDGTLSDTARGAAFRLTTAGARGCWVLSRPLVLAPCVGAEVMVLSAHGFGANRPSDVTAVAWAPDATFILGVPLGTRFMLRAGVGLALPTSRQAFVIASGTSPDVIDSVVHRPASVAARGWLGPEIVF